MRIAIYCRVSTDDQDNDNQLRELREYCRKREFIVIKEYSDIESGGKADRPQFKRMFADAHKREFDLVLFWALDRFSREGVLATLTYLNQLDACGVGFVSYTEQYLDSTGLFRDAVLAILATIAKQERIRKSERTKAGLARVKQEGRILGRPKLGEEKSAQVLSLAASGVSKREITKRVGIGFSAMYRILATSPKTSVELPS